MDPDDEIMRMVRETNDPQTKGMLLVLLRISSNLTANTQLTQDLAGAFENHEKTVSVYMAEGNKMLNRGIGAWKAVAVIGFVVYAAGGFIINSYLNEISSAQKKNAEQDILIAGIKSLLDEHLRQANPMMKELKDRGVVTPP